MKILCHRGYWKEAAEKNTRTAFERGFALGLGTETDIRDCNGTLVISHDMARDDAMPFADFLALVPADVMLALNVKADGLVDQALAELRQADHRHYFFFDMSLPDMLSYLKCEAPVAARLSEYEPLIERLATQARRIWLDAFEAVWYDTAYLRQLLDQGMQVVIVSPELHGRDPEELWPLLEPVAASDQLYLCTDLPQQALARFNR